MPDGIIVAVSATSLFHFVSSLQFELEISALISFLFSFKMAYETNDLIDDKVMTVS